MAGFCKGCNESSGFIKKRRISSLSEKLNFTRGALCPVVNDSLHYEHCDVSNNAYNTDV